MKHSFRPITEDLFELHAELKKQWPCLLKIAVALFDDKTGQLHTFVKSSVDADELYNVDIALSEVPLLEEISQNGEPRLIQDLNVLSSGDQTLPLPFIQSSVSHFNSSYIEPFYLGETLLGFVFYDATKIDYFSEALVAQLKLNTRLIESLITAEILPIKFLLGLVDTTREIVHIRDSDTGKHIMRVSTYLEVMAIELADEFGFSDEQLKYLWYYAPLHDIGKLAIPDCILLKPDRLTVEEIEIMKSHVTEGIRILEMITKNFYFQNLSHFDLLRDLISSHHECWNGSGYPLGLKGEDIPPAGRIMAIADVFDALVMDRVYRAGVPINEVFDFLESKKGTLFDPKCVDAFIKNREIIETIAQDYRDDLGHSEESVGQIRVS